MRRCRCKNENGWHEYYEVRLFKELICAFTDGVRSNIVAEIQSFFGLARLPNDTDTYNESPAVAARGKLRATYTRHIVPM
jgi:hypothetical protein